MVRFYDADPDYPLDSTWANSKMLEQAAILHYLFSTELAVSSVYAYDATVDNAMSRPYVLQEPATGLPLIDIYEGLSLSARLSIAKALADFYVSMEAITCERCGQLRYFEKGKTAAHASATKWRSRIKPTSVGINVHIGGFTVGKRIRIFNTVYVDKALTNLYEFLFEQPHCWKELEEVRFEDASIWQGLCTILEQMKDCGFFDHEQLPSAGASQSRNILHHWDLEPRNIIVKQKTDSVPSNEQ